MATHTGKIMRSSPVVSAGLTLSSLTMTAPRLNLSGTLGSRTLVPSHPARIRWCPSLKSPGRSPPMKTLRVPVEHIVHTTRRSPSCTHGNPRSLLGTDKNACMIYIVLSRTEWMLPLYYLAAFSLFSLRAWWNTQSFMPRRQRAISKT